MCNIFMLEPHCVITFLSSGIVPELLGSLGFQSSNQQFRPPTNKRARFPIWTNQCARLKLNHITITLIGDWCLIVLTPQSHCFESVPELYSKQAATEPQLPDLWLCAG